MPANSIIPDWLYVSDPSGQLRAKSSQEFQRLSKPVSLQAPGIAEDSVIPIVYGGPERLGGMPYTVGTAAGSTDLLVSYLLCEGPIAGVASIEFNDAAPPAGVTYTVYTGTTTQDVDPWLAAAISGFTEKLPGTAYIVARFAAGAMQSIPRLTAEVMGRLVLDRSQKGVAFAPVPLNQYAKMSESAQSSIHGATDIEVTFIGALAQWAASASPQVLVSKWHQPNLKIAAGLQISPAGALAFYFSSTGVSFASEGFVAPLQVPLAPGQSGGLRLVANLADHGARTGQFYYSTDGIVWLPLGALVTVDNNLVPATPLNQAPWGGPAQIVADGTLAGLPAWRITDSSNTAHQNWFYQIPVTAGASRYAWGFRIKKTSGGTAPSFEVNASLVGGVQNFGRVWINTDTGAATFGPLGGTVNDAGDHWDVRTAIQNNGANTAFNYNLLPAWSPNGVAAADVSSTGSHTVAGLWFSNTVTDVGGMQWQVSSRSDGAENYPAVGTVTRASVTWGGVEHVRFNPEDAADGAATWLAPTGEAWTVAGGSTVQPRAATASTNPAIILDDFMRTFGRRTVNAASVKAARDYCDALVSGEPRARLTLTLKEARNVDEWIEVLRGYIPAWVIYKQSEWHIIPDTVSAPVLAYNADTDNRTDGDAPMALFKRGAREVPNVVELVYTETGVKPWTDKRVAATLPGLGTGQRRKATVSMPGIRRYSQAYRFAVERLNHYTLESIEGEVAVMDSGIAVTPGDIVTITDSAHGWLDKQVRVLRVDERDNGRWALRFREFNPLAYSTDAPVAPPLPSSGTLPNPINVAAITGLTASESLKYENAAINTSDALARGLIWQSRIVASWAASVDPFLDYYEVRIQGATLAQPSVTTSKLAQFCSAALIQGTTYQLDVRVVNSLGFAGPWAGVSVPVLGKQLPPSNVTVLDFAAEIGGDVILRWRAVPDVDVVRYEWRALATSAATAAWDSMALVDRPDTTYARFKGFAPGATLFAVKAIDSVGRYSVAPLYINVTVTSDASNFLQSFDFIPQTGQPVNQYDWPLIEGDLSRPLPRWISAGDVAWDAAMPNPVASGVAPVVVSGYGRTGSAPIYCQIWDFGLLLEATAKINLSWARTLRGAVNVHLATSPDASTWDYGAPMPLNIGAGAGVVSRAITARYVFIAYFPAASSTIMQEGPVQVQISSTTRSESGNGTSVASGPTRVNLAQKYTKAVSIVITPRGTTFATGSYDNVIVGLAVAPNHFDVYLFNSVGVQIAQAFSWNFEGV